MAPNCHDAAGAHRPAPMSCRCRSGSPCPATSPPADWGEQSTRWATFLAATGDEDAPGRTRLSCRPTLSGIMRCNGSCARFVTCVATSPANRPAAMSASSISPRKPIKANFRGICYSATAACTIRTAPAPSTPSPCPEICPSDTGLHDAPLDVVDSRLTGMPVPASIMTMFLCPLEASASALAQASSEEDTGTLTAPAPHDAFTR